MYRANKKKAFFKNVHVEGCRDGSAKTTATRCRHGVCRKDRPYKDYTSDDLSCVFLSLYSAVFHNFVHIATMKAEEVQAHIRKM